MTDLTVGDRPIFHVLLRSRHQIALHEIAELDGVTVASPYEPGGERLQANDGDAAGTIAYAELQLDPDLSLSSLARNRAALAISLA